LTVGAQALISNLTARGITLTPNGDSVVVRPRERLTDADRAAIRHSKPALLAHLRAGMELRRERATAPDSRHPLIEADREQAAIDHIAQLDAERREADRQANRGYDFDPSAPSHAEREEAEIDRLASIDGWRRLLATTGDLLVGRAGAKADEPTQPWPSFSARPRVVTF
jgi:TubC N-terminal docking domain